MAHILAIRFSSLGDIAMAIPVVYAFAQQYPEHEITLLSRQMASSLFQNAPKNVHFKGVNLKNYKGLKGLFRLFQELNRLHIDAVADFHDVIRTIVLRTAFSIKGVPTAHIQKDRRGKRLLTHPRHRQLKQLTPSIERYMQVLERLGYPIQPAFTSIYKKEGGNLDKLKPVVGEKGENRWIGIAPFAAHESKIYPTPLMEKVIELLVADGKTRIFLFGAGKREKEWCQMQESKFQQVTSLVGRYSMADELALMSHLDTILTMDSANMHLAALTNLPVVSIWGATHPYAGFAGLQPKGSKILQIDMDCRPCSIFGNKECLRGHRDCLWNLQPEIIVKTINEVCHART